MDIKKIISQYNDRNTIYQNGLTNHLNMGLYALYQMHADEGRLHDYATTYIREKDVGPMEPSALTIDDDNFYDQLGQSGNYSAFIDFFNKKVKQDGMQPTFKKYLNILKPGFPGGAFHGLIRLAYSVELDDSEEKIKALSYMAECYHPFKPKSVEKDSSDIVGGLVQLSESPYFKNFKFQRPLIIGRMEDVYEDQEFYEFVTELDEDSLNIQVVTELIIELYGMTDDFTILHGVTSTHALRVLQPYLEDFRSVLKSHWFHLQLAYASTGCTPMVHFEVSEVVEIWQDIFNDAVQVKDVHTIKLVYSLFYLSGFVSDDQIYRYLARRKVSGTVN